MCERSENAIAQWYSPKGKGKDDDPLCAPEGADGFHPNTESSDASL